MPDDLVRASKFLSLVLRHKPETIGLELDANGWADVDTLLRRSVEAGVPLTPLTLGRLVAESDKQRFALSEDGTRVRANQGHSVEVDLELKAVTPPGELFHGTATRFLVSIRERGLIPGSRQHVHLSADVATAEAVGRRHGRAVVLRVDAAAMAAAGRVFYLSANGVWLTDAVPPEFLAEPAG